MPQGDNQAPSPATTGLITVTGGGGGSSGGDYVKHRLSIYSGFPQAL